MRRVLRGNSAITRLLIRLFESRFDPDKQQGAAERCEAITEELRGQLDEVTSLDADRILRSYLALIDATLRTNYYKQDTPGPGPGVDGPPSLVLKLDPGTVPGMRRAAAQVRDLRLLAPAGGGAPALRPGGARRAALVGPARGLPHRGARPGQGAGGQERGHRPGHTSGFVCKRLPDPADREATQAEVLACYKTFIAGMLDVTDNIDGDRVVPPPGVVRRDGDDPYLVVAADKGTATFSDTANEVAGRFGTGSATRSPRAAPRATTTEDGHHRARRLGVGEVALRRARAEPRHGRSPRSTSATCPATCSATEVCSRTTSGWWRRSTSGTCSSSRRRTRRPASPSARGCSSCPGPRRRHDGR